MLELLAVDLLDVLAFAAIVVALGAPLVVPLIWGQTEKS